MLTLFRCAEVSTTYVRVFAKEHLQCDLRHGIKIDKRGTV